MKILFIHHSIGGLLLKYGQVRETLKKTVPEIELWDHGYNRQKGWLPFIAELTYHTGLSDADGKMTGTDYNISLSNNSPKEYDQIFSRDPSDFTLKSILSYDVIIFKNCFPTTKIVSDAMLEDHKKHYASIVVNLRKYPQKQFFIFTPPPLRSEMTRRDYAKRARILSDWMIHSLTSGNISVFDFFDLLVDSDGQNANMLKREYSPFLFFDSHPNKNANKDIGPIFVKEIVKLMHK